MTRSLAVAPRLSTVSPRETRAMSRVPGRRRVRSAHRAIAASAPQWCGPDPRITVLLWRWLALGAVLVLLVPAARGSSALLGAWPLWLVFAPLSSLAVAYRQRLVRVRPVAALVAILVAHQRRHRPHWRAQARRLVAGRNSHNPALRVA